MRSNWHWPYQSATVFSFVPTIRTTSASSPICASCRNTSSNNESIEPMTRAVGWLCILVLALAAHWYDSDILRGACACGALALLAVTAPASLRVALGFIAIVAVGI